MKNISKNIKILFVGLMLVSIAACDLNEFPEHRASRETIFGSASAMELYVNSFYRRIHSTEDGVYLIDDQTDLMAGRLISDRFRPGQLTPVTSGGWGQTDEWSWLRNINYFIEHAENSSIAERHHFMGVAHFFRAWWYYDRVKRFGDVPWIDVAIDPLDDERLYAGRDSRFFIMDRIVEDLDFAIANISMENDPTSTRITKNVARAFKSRVCLYEGSLRKYHTNYSMQHTANDWFRKAVEAANAVTGHSLREGDNVYRDMFLQKAPYADETILAIALSADLQLFSARNRKTISPTYGNRPALTRRFVLTYLNSDGTPFSSRPDYRRQTYMEEIVGRDPRLGQTIRMPNYVRTSGGTPMAAPPNMEQSITGYQIIKGCYDEMAPFDNESRNENAHLVIRYAEVLLNKAEALVELGEMTPAEWDNTIGALRRRAGITGNLERPTGAADPYMVEFYDNKWTDAVMLEVLRERTVELVQEGLRPDDLVRWRLGNLFAETPFNGIYVPGLGGMGFTGTEDGTEENPWNVYFYQGTRPENVSARYFMDVTPSTATGRRQLSNGDHGEIMWFIGEREWQDRLYLYPIPESALLRNPELGQNPGWE